MSERAKEDLRLWLYMLKTTRDIEADLRDLLRTDFDNTLARFDIMSVLHRFPEGLKMSAISDYLMISKGNVTGMVDRMSEDGYVDRVPVAEDRRAYLVKLTDKGIAAFDEQAAAHSRLVSKRFNGLDDMQLDALLDTLKKLRRNR